MRTYVVGEDLYGEPKYGIYYIKVVFLETPDSGFDEEDLNNITIGRVIDLIKRSRVINPRTNVVRIVEKVEKILRENNEYFDKRNPSFNPVYEQYYCEEKCRSSTLYKDFGDCVADCIKDRHCVIDDEFGFEETCEMEYDYESGKVVCNDDCDFFPNPLTIYDESIKIAKEKGYFVEELLYLLELVNKLSIGE